jgi:2-hydroxy-6-oxonona-2,4-dienedioate hydrolase
MLSAIAERFAEAGGIRTRYLESGSGPALILVHGGHYGSIGCAEDWLPVIPLLAREFRVIAIDKPGCGFSGNPPSDDRYVIGTTVTHLHDFLGALGLSSAHFAGHSRGGYTVVNLAMDHPRMVDSLIVVSSATLMAAPNPIYKTWDQEARKIDSPREQWRYRLAANSWSDKHLTDEFLDLNVAIEKQPKYIEARTKMHNGLWSEFRDDLNIQREKLKARILQDGIPCPLLLTWGYNDPSARLDPTGLEAMRILVPASKAGEFHVFNHAGHYVYREQATRFSEVTARFLNSASNH